ncbi:MAG: gliding motility lipoprotein GldH [Prevotella sp.]
MKRNKAIAAMMILTVASALLSCNRKTVYDHYEPIDIDGWEKDDTVTFSIKPMDEGGTYDEAIGLRTTTAFPFRSVCLIVEQRVMPGGSLRCDTLLCSLMDDNGKVTGDGVGCYQYIFPLADMTLAKGDSLHIAVRHNMRREILPGISDLGIRLKRK